MINYLEKESDFEKEINKELILVDFYADWCGPCKAMMPILEELENIQILKINVDLFPDLASSYGIMSIPTLILFKNGKELDKKVGLINKSNLEKWLKENK